MAGEDNQESMTKTKRKKSLLADEVGLHQGLDHEEGTLLVYEEDQLVSRVPPGEEDPCLKFPVPADHGTGGYSVREQNAEKFPGLSLCSTHSRPGIPDQ